jgi:hypothetical protein
MGRATGAVGAAVGGVDGVGRRELVLATSSMPLETLARLAATRPSMITHTMDDRMALAFFL